MSDTNELTTLPKGRAYDDADGHVEHAAAHGKLPEFIKHSAASFPQ